MGLYDDPLSDDELQQQALRARQLPSLSANGPIASPSARPPVDLPQIGPKLPSLQSLEAEQDRLTNPQLPSHLSGVDQFSQKHHILGPMLKTMDVMGSIFAPGISAQIPGTTMHHRELVGQNAQQIAGQERQQETEAQTANLQNQPELREAKLQLERDKADEAAQKNSNQDEATFRKQGLKRDEHGALVPLEYGDMSPTEQAAIDLKKANVDAKQAQADLARFKADPNSPQYQLAKQRLSIAQQNANTAAQRLGFEHQKFNADYEGIGPNGQELAGVTHDDKGRAIGPRVANANAAPGTRLVKGDLATNVHSNAAKVNQLIDANPDLFGKVAGRYTSVRQMAGTGDPAIAELGVHIHNMALASNGIHGVKGQGAVEQTENEILNHFRNSPQATKAAINAMVDSTDTFAKDAQLGKRPSQLPEQAGPAAGGTGKTLSVSAIQQAAKDHNISVDEAKRQATAAGYQVQ